MTAFIVYLEQDRAHLLSDGGMFDDNGAMVGAVAKAIIMPEKPMVFVARGALVLTVCLRAQIESAPGCFDDVMAALPGHVAAAYSNAQRHNIRFGEEHLDLAAIGWSEQRQRAEAYAFGTHGAYGPAGTPRSLNDAAAPCVLIAPSDAAMMTRLARLGIDPWSLDADPARDGLAIMREQRFTRGGNPRNPDPSNVGGFCQMTTLERHSITTRVLERWERSPRVNDTEGAVA